MAGAVSLRAANPEIHRYVIENPRDIAIQENRKASLYSLVSKVSLLAIAAIAITALGITFGLITPIHPLFIGAPLLGAALGLNATVNRLQECKIRAGEAEERAKELDRIRDWKRPQIESFFKEHNLSLSNLPMDLLRKIDPKEPLRALLPAIATYSALCKEAKKLYQEHEENLYNTLENPTLHLGERRIGWRLLEFKAIPAALEAALALQIISQPTLSLQLEDLGILSKKDFDERRFDQLLEGRDEYFIFKDEKRPPLTFAIAQELAAKQNINGLRQKLFPL